MAPSLAARTFGLAVVIALAQAACAAEPGSSIADTSATPSDPRASAPARTPSAECINPPVDLLTLINQTDPVACYGDMPITVEAEVGGIGAIDCAALEPAWFSCGSWVSLQPIAAQAGTGGFVLAATTGPNARPQLYVAIHPDALAASANAMGRPLRVTGHYDDPAAQTCRQPEGAFGGPTDPPEVVIAWCRSLFVLTAFDNL
jgi:hypothetical protein